MQLYHKPYKVEPFFCDEKEKQEFISQWMDSIITNGSNGATKPTKRPTKPTKRPKTKNPKKEHKQKNKVYSMFIF